jgi:hypothetical protein
MKATQQLALMSTQLLGFVEQFKVSGGGTDKGGGRLRAA